MKGKFLMAHKYKKIVAACVTTILAVLVVSLNGCMFQAKGGPIIDIKSIHGDEYAVIIIGGGPAALNAGLRTGWVGLKTLMIQGGEPGGQLMGTTTVDNYLGFPGISGPELIGKFTTHVQRHKNIEFMPDTVESVDFSTWPYAVTTAGGQKIRGLAVIIATGATPTRLGVMGEDIYWGHGLTTCAKCDAPFYSKDSDEVVVIGGGDSAAEMALQLVEHAKKIKVLVRKDSMRASRAMQERLRAYPSTIEIIYNVGVEDFKGTINEKYAVLGEERMVSTPEERRAILEEIHHIPSEQVRSSMTAGKTTGLLEDLTRLHSITLKNNKTNELIDMPINGAFLAIGHTPNTQMFQGIVPMNEGGYLQAIGRTQQTAIPGVFVAGEVDDDLYKQADSSVGEGGKAGLDAERFLMDIGFRSDMLGATQLKSRESTKKGEIQPIASLSEFEKAVLKASMPVIVDVYGDNCTACKYMEPALEQTAAETTGRIHFVKIDGGVRKDGSKNPAADILLAIKDRFGVFVQRLPHVLAFKDGKLVAQFQKAVSKKEFDELVAHLEQA